MVLAFMLNGVRSLLALCFLRREMGMGVRKRTYPDLLLLAPGPMPEFKGHGRRRYKGLVDQVTDFNSAVVWPGIA